ncbi:MAG: XdhC family protein [Alphaproteobacteria bacterium]
MRTSTLDTILDARARKEPFALATHLSTGAQAIVLPDGVDGELALDEGTLAAAHQALRDDRSGRVETADGPVFVHVFNPPKRMVLVGAVHIAQALAPMAALAGYDVTIVDPRGAFATATRFPNVNLTDTWPDDALEELAPDSRTAVITLTHDPKLDDPALGAALRSDAFYIGALGSRKTQGARLRRLKKAGFSDDELARVHGPVGLSIGAKSPAEIAVSILAQVTEVLHQGVSR